MLSRYVDLMDPIERVQYKVGLIILSAGLGFVGKNCTKNFVGNRHCTYLIMTLSVTKSDLIFAIRTERYENTFFPYTIKAWKELDGEIFTLRSEFQEVSQSFYSSPGFSLFGISYKSGINFLAKIRVSFSDFSENPYMLMWYRR